MPELANKRTYDLLASKRDGEAEPGAIPIPGGLELAAILSASATLDFPNTAAQLSADLTVAVPGAALGDVVAIGVPNAAVNANSCFTAWVSAVNVVSVRFSNFSAGAIDPASGIFRVLIFRLK